MTIVVNGEKINPELIEQEITMMRPDYQKTFHNQPKADQEKQLKQWAQENVIEKVLIRQTAWEDPNPVDPDLINAEYKKLIEQQGGEKAFLERAGLKSTDLDNVKQDIEQHIRIGRLIEQINEQAGEVTEKEAENYYRNHKDHFRIPEQVRAAHIVVHTDSETSVTSAKTRIEAIEEDLNKGKPFEQIADEMSDCPGNGGDLGYFGRGEMVQQFEDVVFSMQPEQISGVFQTEFGFHIAKVHDKKHESMAPFERVKEVIIEHLTSERRRTTLESFLDKKRKAADIREIND